MTPLAIAKEKGFFAEEGLTVTLEPQANWKVLLDGVIGGQLDGAHMLAGQPIAASIGLGVKGDLVALVRAVHLSRAVLRNIKQNLFWAFTFNAAGLPLAAGVLYPFTGWLLNPMFASVAMSLSSITVVTNALRLRRLRL